MQQMLLMLSVWPRQSHVCSDVAFLRGSALPPSGGPQVPLGPMTHSKGFLWSLIGFLFAKRSM